MDLCYPPTNTTISLLRRSNPRLRPTRLLTVVDYYAAGSGRWSRTVDFMEEIPEPTWMCSRRVLDQRPDSAASESVAVCGGLAQYDCCDDLAILGHEDIEGAA